MVGIRDSHVKNISRKLKILQLQSQYIYLLLLFVINNRQHFKINSDVHNVNTINNLDLHYPLSHLSVYQKDAHHTRIKVFNRLLVPIKQLSHDLKQFKIALKGLCIFILFIHWMNILNTI
jgi:hypothetical protein